MFRAMYRVFDYSGRSTRWEYWSFILGWAVLLLIATAWAANYQQTHFGLAPQLDDNDAAGLGFALLIFFVAPAFALKVRRFHDFGWSGWAALWLFVPLVNLAMELMLLFRGSLPEEAAYPAHAQPQPITIYNTPGIAAAGGSHHHGSDADEIGRLAAMHTQGLLSAGEFSAAKARLLRR